MINRSFFCGPFGITAWPIFQLKKVKSSASTWFSEEMVFYVHRARTAISHLPDLLEIKAGDEVLMPAYNCGSEIDSFLKLGILVVFFRIDASGKIDIEDIKRKVSGKSKAVYVTHYFGFPQDLADLQALCKQRGLFLIEDCALSLFSSDDNRKLGYLGDVAVASFPKTLPLLDGGALIVNNQTLRSKTWALMKAPVFPVYRRLLPLIKASVLRYLSRKPFCHPIFCWISGLLEAKKSGVHSNLAEKWKVMPESYYYKSELDNRRMSFLSKRMLDRFDYTQVVETRRKNYLRLLSMFSDNPNVMPLFRVLPPGVCPLFFPVIVQDREKICIELNKQHIYAMPWWAGYHRDLSWNGFEEARFLKDHVVALPIHQDLTDDEVNFIGNRFLAAI